MTIINNKIVSFPLRDCRLLDHLGNYIDIQTPISIDGDSVYAKDINVVGSDVGTFTGDIVDLFKGYTSSIDLSDTSSTNPKYFIITFNRPIETDSIGIGSATQKLSNVKILLKDQFGADRAVVDDSANNTKYSSNIYSFEPEIFIQAKVEFHTVDEIELTGMFITKDSHTTARIEAQKPDGTATFINATAGSNLKISLEEYDSSFNTNPIPVIQTDSAGRKAELDNLFKVPIIIDVQHHEIHEGDSFSATHDDTLANGGTISLSFKTPATTKQPHFTFLGRSSGESSICLNEGVTATSSTGNQHPVYNRKRDSANETDLLEDTAGTGFTAGNIAEGATISGGTCIYEEHFGAGQTRGGATAGRNEFLLAPDTEYEVVLTSEAASNDCEVILDWYEHTGE